MVKLKGPSLAAGAAGTLGGELIFSSNKGRAYLKKHRKPKQPQSPDQLAMRAMMAFLGPNWDAISDAQKATWDQLAEPQRISSCNAYQGENLKRWRRFRPPTKAYPAAESSTPCATPKITAYGGVRHVQLKLYGQAPILDNWTGFLFHRALTGYPDVQFSECIHVLLIDALGANWWTHQPLPAGRHYYKLGLASDDGNAGFPPCDTAWADVT